MIIFVLGYASAIIVAEEFLIFIITMVSFLFLGLNLMFILTEYSITLKQKMVKKYI